MLGDLKFSAALLGVVALAFSGRLLPGLLEKPSSGATSQTGAPALELPAADAGALTTIVPDAIASGGETIASGGETIASGEVVVLNDTNAAALAVVEAPDGAPSSLVEEAPVIATPESASLAGAPVSVLSTAKAGAHNRSAANIGEAKLAPKEGSVAFAPFVETESPVATRSRATSAGAVDGRRDRPREEFRQITGEPYGTAVEDGAHAAAATEHARGKVRSYDVSATKASAGGNPVHPYFKRYLDAKAYFVRQGDTLDAVAERLYQDRSMAERILELNGDQLRHAGDLAPGMTLRLP